MLRLGMALVSRIDNVHLYVRDMERSTAFYRAEYGVSFEVIDPDGYRVYLFQPPA